jgi:hypothetical protein
MKKMLIIFFVLHSFISFGQTDRDLLLEIIKQQATNNAKIDALQKQMDVRFEGINQRFEGVNQRFDGLNQRFEAIDKRFDTTNMFIVGIMGLLGVLIGVIFWDRRTVIKPIETKTDELQKEIFLLKQRELKLEEKEQKLEEKLDNYIKKLAQIDPRFTGIL